MSLDLQGKVALITGANRGIGKATLTAFVHEGVAKIYAGVRNLESADPLLKEYGTQVVPVVIDLNQPKTIEQAAQVANDVEIVMNNAGVLYKTSPLSTNAIEKLQAEIEINVFGLMRMAQAFAPILKNNGGGAFVQMNSIASMKSFASFATYSASKAAAYSITQALRELLAEQGTLVLSVHPGPIATTMADQAGLGELAEPPELVSEGIVAALKTGQFHLFPDTMAKQVGEAYDSFATNIVEVNLME